MSLKNCNCHQLLTLISFQTCMTYFIYLFFYVFWEMSIHWKSTGTKTVINICLNIFYCVSQNKESHTGLEWYEGELYNYPFKHNPEQPSY